jgi:hypothetical protein
MFTKRLTSNPYIISSTELNTLPTLNFSGRIKFIDSTNSNENHDTDESIRALLSINAESSHRRILGLDTESKPSSLYSKTRNKTALVQISSENACVIWRTRDMTNLPRSLVSIMSDETVLKVGQGISGDITALKEDFGADFEPRNFIDLYKIALRLQFNPKSLKGMVGIFLRKRLLKDMRISDWEQPVLRHEQIQYAAIDAWASRAVALEMNNQGIDIESIGRVEQSDFQKPSHPDHVFEKTDPSKPMVTPPVETILSKSVSSQVQLVELCVSEGHALKLVGFEKDPVNNGRFKCVFECRTNAGQSIRVSSVNNHSSIRSAQEDAAGVLLARLVVP